MADNLGNLGGGFQVKSLTGHTVVAFLRVDVGGTGAPTLTGPPGFSITRTGTGAYDVVAPAVPAAKKAVLVAFIAKSEDVYKIVGTAESPTTGAWSFQVWDETAGETDPAPGDVLYFVYLGEPYSA